MYFYEILAVRPQKQYAGERDWQFWVSWLVWLGILLTSVLHWTLAWWLVTVETATLFLLTYAAWAWRNGSSLVAWDWKSGNRRRAMCEICRCFKKLNGAKRYPRRQRKKAREKSAVVAGQRNKRLRVGLVGERKCGIWSMHDRRRRQISRESKWLISGEASSFE